MKTKMTVSELFDEGVAALNGSEIEDSEFNARCMLEDILGLRTAEFFLCRGREINDSDENTFHKMIQRRIDGEPLQYILGQWEFMGFPFYVGSGVLIPRPETEMLVDFAVDFLQKKESPVVLDLCSGSGCIAVSVAKLVKNSTVYAVEKSEKAFKYLQKNIELNGTAGVHAVLGDIFDRELLLDVVPDLILSNPPYIRSADINSLQREVQKEPKTALDGGMDGYDFYREIVASWLPRLKLGGAIAVECAEDQTVEISKMFSRICGTVKAANDFSGLPRIVSAIK